MSNPMRQRDTRADCDILAHRAAEHRPRRTKGPSPTLAEVVAARPFRQDRWLPSRPSLSSLGLGPRLPTAALLQSSSAPAVPVATSAVQAGAPLRPLLHSNPKTTSRGPPAQGARPAVGLPWWVGWISSPLRAHRRLPHRPPQRQARVRHCRRRA